MACLSWRSAPLWAWPVLLSLPVIGGVIGLLGPFASYGDMGLAGRIGHFALCVTVIGTASLGISYLVARRFFLGYWPLWAALGVDCALALPGAAVVYASLALFAPAVLAHVSPGQLFWQNLLMTLLFRAFSLFASWRRIRDGADIDIPDSDAVVADALAGKLPYALRHEPVLALSSEDHYLRVHTPRGEALIHMTLAGAIAVLPDGFQIHRSHWIARAAIRSAGSAHVELRTGLRLPLSRHRARAFRDWLVPLSVTTSN